MKVKLLRSIGRDHRLFKKYEKPDGKHDLQEGAVVNIDNEDAELLLAEKNAEHTDDPVGPPPKPPQPQQVMLVNAIPPSDELKTAPKTK
jgi:hypothetical protein